jgi:hypothetical protein
MKTDREGRVWRSLPWVAVIAMLVLLAALTLNRTQARQDEKPKDAPSSYDQIAPVLVGKGTFESVREKDKADKPAVMERQMALLKKRYNLDARPDEKVKMTRGKPIQVGPATRLPDGMTWEKLAGMTPEAIKEKDLFPAGFLPLPHPKHEAGGMLFPDMEIKQLARLKRFDLDFDIPEHFLPEFPPAMFLTTRKDLGDVSKGKMVTMENSRSCSPASSTPRTWTGCACSSCSSRSSSSTPPPTARRRISSACRASPASTVTSTATRRPRPT